MKIRNKIIATAIALCMGMSFTVNTMATSTTEIPVTNNKMLVNLIDTLHTYYVFMTLSQNYNNAVTMLDDACLYLIFSYIDTGESTLQEAVDELTLATDSTSETLSMLESNFIHTSVIDTTAIDAIKYFFSECEFQLVMGGISLSYAYQCYENLDFVSMGEYLNLYYDFREEAARLKYNIQFIAELNYNAIRQTLYRETPSYSIVGDMQSIVIKDYETTYSEMIDEYLSNKNKSWEKAEKNVGEKSIVPKYEDSSSTNEDIDALIALYLNTEAAKTVVLPTVPASVSFPLHLYSNDGKTYLGKCVTDEWDKNGIYYKFYGDYSSEFGTNSIWNELGPWGSNLHDTSAFNERATKPPKIVDNNGNFIGYLTTNPRIENAWSIEQLRQFLVNNNH